MSEDKDDKQFEASEQKLRKARDEGNVVRSTEVNAAAMYLGAWLAFGVAAGVAVNSWLPIAAKMIGDGGWPAGSVFDLAKGAAKIAALATLALSVVPAVIMLAGIVAQRALIFSGKKLAPDLKRIDPFKNAGQKFGKSGLVTFVISLAKAMLVCAGGYYLFASLLSIITNSASLQDAQWITLLKVMLARVLVMALIISVVFAGIDYLWKRHEHRRDNRMSRKEMEDEHKESEGDPHLKAARRQKAVDLAMGQMLADVAQADVVIVNPTHYAVALEWKRGSGRAPVCLAKGVDEIAARIREKANENGVPIWSDPPCARAIHATVKIGEEIQTEQFSAVAAAIRFAEKMRIRARAGW